MSSSKITLVGLYSFLMYDNIDLFSELKLPEGIDKDTVVSNILQKSSEFEVQYPDTDYMINSIKFWSSKWYWTFDKWVKAINIKYEPLHNYDRTEQWSDDNEHSDGHTKTGSNSFTDTGSTSGSQSETTTGEVDTTVDTTEEVEGKKSAFNSGTYEPYEHSDTTIDNDTHTETTDSTTVENSTSNSLSHNGSDSETLSSTGAYTTTHTGRMFGNIGITSSQDMLNQELQIAYFNLYDRIADIFISEYCIPVYI